MNTISIAFIAGMLVGLGLAFLWASDNVKRANKAVQSANRAVDTALNSLERSNRALRQKEGN